MRVPDSLRSWLSSAAQPLRACLVVVATLPAACAYDVGDPLDPSLEGVAVEPGSGSATAALDAEAGGTRIRVVTGNLTSGPGATYSANGPAARIFSALQPDVALLQEFRAGRGNDDVALDAFVEQAFGADRNFYRPTSDGIPNGIVTRFPILESGSWRDENVHDRAFTWARIDVPGPRSLLAVSVHLLTSTPSARAEEATALVNLIQENVHPDDFVVVGGDLNTKGFGENALRILSTIVSTNEKPVDERGTPHTNRNRNRPYDWVLPSPALDAHAVPVEFGGQTFEEGLVFDTRVVDDRSAMSPCLGDDSAADGMQHMLVVKEFVLPNNES